MFSLISTFKPIHALCRQCHHVGTQLNFWILFSFPFAIKTWFKPLPFIVVEWKVVIWSVDVQQIAFFFLLCTLAIFCCWDVTPKPNLLCPKGWALNLTLKFLWSCSLIALIVVTNHALLNLTLYFFSTFLWVVFFVVVSVSSTHFDIFSFFFGFLFFNFINNFFIQYLLSQHYQVLVWCDHMWIGIIH